MRHCAYDKWLFQSVADKRNLASISRRGAGNERGSEMKDHDLEWKWTLACVAVLSCAFLAGCAAIVR